MITKSNLLLFLRVVFGTIFVFSGIVKLRDLITFADAVRSFEIVQDPIAPAIALLIPWFEILGGLTVMSGFFWRGGIFVILASLMVFTVALTSASARGLDITCGCFGGSGIANYPLLIGRNGILLVVGGTIGILLKKKSNFQ